MDTIDSKPTAELMAELQALKSRCARLEQVLSQRHQSLPSLLEPEQRTTADLPVAAGMENEERLLTLINATPDIICFKDGAGRWLLANQADLELFELTGIDYKGKKDSELADYSQFYREAFLACENTDEIAWRANGISRGDEIIPLPDGTQKVYDVIKVPLFYPDARRKGLVVLGRDVTERHQVEQSLQAWMSRLDALLNSLQVGILFEDEQRQILLVNPTFYRLFGLPDGMDLTGYDCRQTIDGAKQMFRDQDSFVRAVETAIDGQRIVAGLEFRTVDDRTFECDYMPVSSRDGQRGHLWQYRDVTARVQMEQTLRASETRNRSLLGAIPDLLFVLDHSGKILDYKADSLNDLLLPPEQFLNRHVPEVFSPPLADGFMHALRLAVESGQPQSYEYELALPNHSSGNYEARFVVSDDAQVLVLIRDITEQKQIQIRVKSSLAEKEMLLKEIHHRVKNNLQIVNSLLYLQSKNIQEPELRAIFQESQNRVRTMSLIHEQLYQADDLARIDFAVYLKTLSRNLFQTYRSGNAINLRLNVQNVSLTIDQAIPCGLIINELISNSLKYAFPNDRAGMIEVQFYHDAAYTLVVRDDGVGFPADPDLAGICAREMLKIYSRRSLGLQLVENLVRQLDGQIEMFLDHGVMYKISFA